MPRRAVSDYVRKYLVAPRYRPEFRQWLTTADGLRLAAWRIPGPADAPASIVLVHGFANWSRNPRIHAFAQRLAADCTVVVPDLRGHGDSGGRCTIGRDEALDVAAAVAACPPDRPVVTVGLSLGGAAVLVHAATHRGTVAGVIAVSAPAQWNERAGAQSLRVKRFVDARAGRAVMAGLLRTRIALDRGDGPDPVDGVHKIGPAFLVVAHDPHDGYFGREHAELLYERALVPKELWWFEGRGHGTDLLGADLAGRVIDAVHRYVGAQPLSS